jgi:hypothetical protein
LYYCSYFIVVKLGLASLLSDELPPEETDRLFPQTTPHAVSRFQTLIRKNAFYQARPRIMPQVVRMLTQIELAIPFTAAETWNG